RNPGRRPWVLSATRRLPGQPERTSLGVPADRPSLPRVHDAPPERFHSLQRLSDIGDREVGQRKGIAWASSALVDADRWAWRVRLPAIALWTLAILQLNAEKLSPEVSGAHGVISGKLDEGQRGA